MQVRATASGTWVTNTHHPSEETAFASPKLIPKRECDKNKSLYTTNSLTSETTTTPCACIKVASDEPKLHDREGEEW